MARQRVDTTKKSLPLNWHRVHQMGVVEHTSKRSGREMIRIDYQLHPSVKEWPISDYLDPSHPNDFFRGKWLDFIQAQKDLGIEVKGAQKSIGVIVELSTDWCMPEAVGVLVEQEEDEHGKLRESWDIKRVDWTGEQLDQVADFEMEWPEDENTSGEAKDDETSPAETDQPAAGAGEKENDEDELPF